MAQPHNNSGPVDRTTASSARPTGSEASCGGAPQSHSSNTNQNFATPSQRVAKEEDELARAIAISLQDQSLEKIDPPRSSTRSRQGQSKTESSIELILSLNNAFDALDDPKGDTAIYIGAPSQAPEQNDRDYHYVKTHFDRVHVLDSKTLRLMGEESKFTDRDLLNPSKSFRAQRRLRNEHRVALEAAERKRGAEYRFTYYIDLRPPKEDEEAIILLTELSCTRGVLNWHLAMDHYGLSPLAVLGHDDFGVQIPVQSSIQQADASEVDGKATTGPNTNDPAADRKSSIDAKSPPLPCSPPKSVPEYTALRHHAALEQLLQAIKGNDPKLDSAPKVWTFFALARYFGCAAHERISGWITTWLYTGKNANFIQNNPEVAYRIAMGIRSPDLLKDSFSVLVGERALIEAYGEYRSEILNPLRRNVHGRKLELLDDDERNRIDHAASSLVKRIREVTSSMCRDMDFLRKCPSYKVLETIAGESAEEIETLDLAKKTLKDYVRSRIYYVLCQEQNPMDCHDADMAATLAFRSATKDTFCDVYKSLNQPMRLFTNTFWLALQRTQFETGHSNLATEGTVGSCHDNHYIQGLKGLYKDDPANGITRITRATLDEQIDTVNRMLYRRDVVKGKGKERFEEHIAEISGMSNHDPELRTLESHQVHSHEESLGSQPEPSPPFVQTLTVSNPTKSLLSRSPEDESSPTKRRKTSEPDDVFDDFGAFGKKAPFAMPSALKPELPEGSMDTRNVFQFSPVETTAAFGRETNPLQEDLYGNPAPTKPTWKSRDGVLLHQEAKVPTSSATVERAFTLRPKKMEPDVSVPKNQHPDVITSHDRDLNTSTQDLFVFESDDSNSSTSGVDLDFRASTSFSQARTHSLDPVRENVASDFPRSASAVGDAPGSSSTAPVSTEGHPSNDKLVAGNPAKQSSGWLAAPKKYFNPWTGKWDIWGNKSDHGKEAEARVPGTIHTPLQSTSGNSNRVVKQAFSNSNTPNHPVYYHSSLKDTVPRIPTVSPKNSSHPIDSSFMLQEITNAIGNICSGILYPPHLFHQTGLLPTNLFDTIFCLNENEWRYLPLWAPDGNDDGSGGVFDEMPVPNLDPASANIEAFGPGRIRRGYQDADSIMGGSDIEEINSSQAISTVGKASKLATDGTRTVMSLSSAASVINTVGDNDTVVIASASDEDADAFPEIHVGEDARGIHGDADQAMSDLEKDLGYEDAQDSDEDADTINGDDPFEKEMSESLKNFVASYNDFTAESHDGDADLRNNKQIKHTGEHGSRSDFEFDDAHQIMRVLDNEGNIPCEVDNWGNVTGEKDRGIDKSKGKAKAQNFPYGVHELDQGLGQPLPYRERTSQTQTQHASSDTQIARPGSDGEEDYEFL